MSWHADYVVLNPDGQALYGSRDPDQGIRDALRPHVPDLSTQGMGRVRAWFADDFSNPDLHPNPLADQVLARLGYQHPTGWYGPVAVSMEEDTAGRIPPLDSTVRETVDELLAPADGAAIHAPARTAGVSHRPFEHPLTCADFVRAARDGIELPQLSATGEVDRLQSVAAWVLRAALQETKFYTPDRREQYQYRDGSPHVNHPERYQKYMELDGQYGDWITVIDYPQVVDRQPVTERRYATIRHQADVETLFSRWATARAVADRDPALSAAWDERMRASGADLEAIEKEAMDLVASEPQWHDLPETSAEMWAIRDIRDAIDAYASGDRTAGPLVTALSESVKKLIDETTPHYYEDKAASWTEQVMRADFTRAHIWRQRSKNSESFADIEQSSEIVEEIFSNWTERDDDLGHAWANLDDAVAEWERTPQAMHRFLNGLEQGDGRITAADVPDIELRNQYQGRQITGNGAWVPGPDRHALGQSPDVSVPGLTAPVSPQTTPENNGTTHNSATMPDGALNAAGLDGLSPVEGLDIDGSSTPTDPATDTPELDAGI